MWRLLPPPIEQGDNNNSSNNNGNNGGTENGGGGESENGGGNTGGNTENDIIVNGLKAVVKDTFGEKEEGMYFALHIIGKSEILPARESGIFKLKPKGSLFKFVAYAKDLTFSYSGDTIDTDTLELFSETYKDYGLVDVYSSEYGWTNENGTILNMPFYYGNERFYIPQNKLNEDFKFRTFTIKDVAAEGFMGETTMVACREGHDFKIKSQVIPINEYNPDIHKNIALLTLNFTDTCKYTFKFDGFVKKSEYVEK